MKAAKIRQKTRESQRRRRLSQRRMIWTDYRIRKVMSMFAKIDSHKKAQPFGEAFISGDYLPHYDGPTSTNQPPTAGYPLRIWDSR